MCGSQADLDAKPIHVQFDNLLFTIYVPFNHLCNYSFL